MDKHEHNIDTHSFLGQGWAFPIKFDPRKGGVEMVGGITDIEQSLKILMETLPGERVTNLPYGSRLKEKVYDPIDGKFDYLSEEAIQNAINFYEPRILLDSVKVDKSRYTEGLVFIELFYTVKMTNSRHNLVYPFSNL